MKRTRQSDRQPEFGDDRGFEKREKGDASGVGAGATEVNLPTDQPFRGLSRIPVNHGRFCCPGGCC